MQRVKGDVKYTILEVAQCHIPKHLPYHLV